MLKLKIVIQKQVRMSILNLYDDRHTLLFILSLLYGPCIKNIQKRFTDQHNNRTYFDKISRR